MLTPESVQREVEATRGKRCPQEFTICVASETPWKRCLNLRRLGSAKLSPLFIFSIIIRLLGLAKIY